MRRRIVIDATPLLYTQSGIGRLTRTLIQTLAALASRHELVLFGRRLTGGALSDVGFGLRGTHLKLPRAAEWLIAKSRLADALCRGDLYHATDFYMPIAAVDRAIATVHDLIFLVQPEKMVDHARLASWVPRFARRCRRIIAVSEFSKTDIVKHLGVDPRRIDVVYPGVDRAAFHPPPDPVGLRDRLRATLGLERPYFLAVSCSPGRKNTPFLLDAYATLVRNGPANDLVVAWHPPPELRARYAAGDLGRRIHFVGRQGDPALADLYRGATALVYPSLYEGFGMPLLEAMSCGTPVIASNRTSLPEVGGDAGVYVDPLNRSSLVRALEAFEDSDLPRGLRERCLARASQFSWERCARETLATYDRALGMAS